MRTVKILGLLVVLAAFGNGSTAKCQEPEVVPSKEVIETCCRMYRCGNFGPWRFYKFEGPNACQACRDQAMTDLQCSNLQESEPQPGQFGAELCLVAEPTEPPVIPVPPAAYAQAAPSFVATFTFYPRCGDPVSLDFRGATRCEAYCKGMALVRKLQCSPTANLCCYRYCISQVCPPTCCAPCR